MGFLQRFSVHVQRWRIRNALRRMDGLGQTLRNHAAIDRRKYSVPRPNYLWHTDGHHKLIRWGIVIHGFVDGFCRTVVFLCSNNVSCSLETLQIVGMRASTNNWASTVLQLFLEAVHEFGCPSRVCGDRGGENIEVSIWMIPHRGPNCASFMWGRYVIISSLFQSDRIVS